MGLFNASLKVPGDTSSLAATLLVENGRLEIKAGDQPIGDWSLKEIDLDPMDTGFRMFADGEQLLIEVKDRSGFEEAVGRNSGPMTRKRPKLSSRIKSEKRPKAEKPPKVEKAPKPEELPKPVRETKVSKNGKPSGTDQAATSDQTEEVHESSGLIGRIDTLMDRAERRFGALLPSWVFGRPTVLVLAILLLVTIFLPSVISSILLLGGLVTVVFGAVVYTDGHLAAKLLPGRSTPGHVLILGVGILLLGVVIGLLAGS